MKNRPSEGRLEKAEEEVAAVYSTATNTKEAPQQIEIIACWNPLHTAWGAPGEPVERLPAQRIFQQQQKIF